MISAWQCTEWPGMHSPVCCCCQHRRGASQPSLPGHACSARQQHMMFTHSSCSRCSKILASKPAGRSSSELGPWIAPAGAASAMAASAGSRLAMAACALLCTPLHGPRRNQTADNPIHCCLLQSSQTQGSGCSRRCLPQLNSQQQLGACHPSAPVAPAPNWSHSPSGLPQLQLLSHGRKHHPRRKQVHLPQGQLLPQRYLGTASHRRCPAAAAAAGQEGVSHEAPYSHMGSVGSARHIVADQLPIIRHIIMA